MSSIDEVYTAVRSLPLADRLRIAERVVHDAVADSEREAELTAGREDSLIGLFSEEPALVDEVCQMAMEDRESRPLRAPDG